MKALLLAGVALIAAPGTALAQSATAPSADPQASGAAVPAPTSQATAPLPGNEASAADVVVTAQRREQSLQDVPVAVSVFTSDQRDKLGIRTIQDFAAVAPGLTFSPSLDRLVLRGVGRLTNIIGSDPGVAVYNDGLYTSSNAEASKTPMFVDRVEVLRGPQGTLYGRNSVGGSINVISKRPKDFFEGEFRISGDEFNGLIPEGYLSGPIIGGLKGRVSVQLGPTHIGEAFHNIGPAGDEGYLQRFLVEAQLQYDFSSSVQLWLKYSHAEWRDSYRYGNLVTPYATTVAYPAGALVPNAGFGYTVPNPGVNDPRTVNTNTPGTDRLQGNHNVVANFSAGLGGVTLKYVGGYSTYKYTQYTDLDLTARGLTTGVGGQFGTFTYDPTYIQEYIEDKQYYSNEVTLANSDASGRFNFIVGGYQYHENFFQPVTQYQGGLGTDNMATSLAAPVCLNAAFAPTTAACGSNPRRAFYRGSGDLTTDSYAGFGQADLEIAPGLKLTAGLRYSRDEKTGLETYRLVQYNPYGGGVTPYYSVDITRGVICGGSATCAYAGTGTATRTLTGNWEGASWRLGADYKAGGNTLLFASYSRGLKAGGFNLGSFAQSPIVHQERVDAYEAGIKSRPLSAVTLNLTGFYYDYDNAQVPVTVPIGTTGLTTTNFFNLPKSRSLGGEAEATWAVTSRLDLSGTYSYLDATIRRGPRLFDDPNSPGNNPVDIAGNRSPGSSRHKVYVSALYDLPTGDDGHVFLAASYAYRSDAFYDVFQSQRGRTPGYDQVDARVTYVDPTGRLTLIVYARNLFDSLGYEYATGFGGTGAAGFGQSYSFTPPRQIGAEMHIKFGR